MRVKATALILIFFFYASVAIAQVDEAREAIDRGEYVRAVNILAALVAERPTPDAYLYLGIAYRRTKENEKAAEVLKEGSERYPQDPRFHNELAGLNLENNDIEGAKTQLRQALRSDPANSYASDMLATIDMSAGDVQSALRSWNKTGRPVIDDILHNYYLSFGSWVVREAVAFHPAGVLRYEEWKTTESRLFATGDFANVGLEVEPTTVPDHYDAVVRTTTKKNSFGNFAVDILKGLPFQSVFPDLWNIGNSGVNFNGYYRWQKDRRRVNGSLKIPLPLPGILNLQLGDTWRSESWNTSPTILPQFLQQARFDYKSNGIGMQLNYIPHYRVEIGGGLLYRNRAASGQFPQLFDSLNTGTFTLNTSLRLVDRRYQNRLYLESFAASHSILGNIGFNGGVAELNNRFTLSKDTRTYFDWTLKGGSSRGNLPIDNYFVLGLDTINPPNPLRGHSAAAHGQYGNGPMGTDFVLVNLDLDRRLATLPLFNTLNIPYLTVKWEVFLDSAKTWDRNHIFQQGKLWIDTGAGLRFETPTHSFNIVYGRSLRDGTGVFTAYVERRLW